MRGMPLASDCRDFKILSYISGSKEQHLAVPWLKRTLQRGCCGRRTIPTGRELLASNRRGNGLADARRRESYAGMLWGALE